MIKTLEKTFNTLSWFIRSYYRSEAAISAISLGAVAIEKHFKLNKNDKSPDSKFSIDPIQMKDLFLKQISFGKVLVGNYSKNKRRNKNIIFRRSLYYTRDLEKGKKISVNDIRSIRPGYGLSPNHLKKVLNKKIKKNVIVGDRVSLEDIE